MRVFRGVSVLFLIFLALVLFSAGVSAGECRSESPGDTWNCHDADSNFPWCTMIVGACSWDSWTYDCHPAVGSDFPCSDLNSQSSWCDHTGGCEFCRYTGEGTCDTDFPCCDSEDTCTDGICTAPITECNPGDTQSFSCGPIDETGECQSGLQLQICPEGVWVNSGGCVGAVYAVAENTLVRCSDGDDNDCDGDTDCDDSNCGPFCTECAPGDVETQACEILNGDCNQARVCTAAGEWPPGWGTCSLNCVCDDDYSWNAVTETCDFDPVSCPGDGLVACTPSGGNGVCDRSRTCNTATGVWELPYTSTCSLNCVCDEGYSWNAVTETCDFDPVSCPGNGRVSCPISNGDCDRSRTCNTATGVWGLPYTSTCSLNCVCDEGYSWDGDSCEAVPCPQCGTPPNNCYSYSTYYRDADGDGLGDPDSFMLACSQPGGYVANNNDCFDGSASCTNDCVTQSFPDMDLDTYGATGAGVRACDGPGNYILDGSDCDDNDALLWNQCCPPGPNDIEIFPKYNTVFWPNVDRIDYAFHNNFAYAGNLYVDTTVAGCFDSSDACWDEALDVVVASGSVLDGNGASGGRSESYCSYSDCTFHGCAWRDCDISEFVCEINCGHEWLPPDTVVTPYGGFTGPGMNRDECCGDDDQEFASAGSCATSTDTTILCCHANDMYNLDGRCVTIDDCPDIMKGAPVWLAAPDDELYGTLRSRTDSVSSFCCDNGLANFDGGLLPSMDSYCGSSDYGCYMSLASVQVTPPDVVGKEFCSDSNDCVLDLCSFEETFSICEESTTCTEEVAPLQLEHLDSMYRCDVESYVVQTNCYPVVDPSSASLPECEEVTEEICEVIGDPQTVCEVLCDAQGTGCTFACPPNVFDCREETTYRNCDASPTGEQVCSTQYSNIVPSDCVSTPVAVCNEFGCAPYECPMNGTSAVPVCPSPYYVVESSLCASAPICNEVACDDGLARTDNHNLRCYDEQSQHGLPFFIKGGNERSSGELVCSPQPEIFDGDYWCPEGFEYDVVQNRCQRPGPICDAGFPGDLQNNCNVLTGTTGFWNMYSDLCMTSGPTSPLNTYDELCCLDVALSSTMGDYQIYTTGNQEANIKVY